MEASRRAPRIVGKYAVHDAVASGGMATVHLGRLMGPVGSSRTVAIKRLHENIARDPELVSMFLDEARLGARIHHPNVVPVLEVVAFGHEPLIVMEYIHGEPLSLLLKRAIEKQRPAPIPVIAEIMIHVLRGLHAAHEATSEEGEPLDIVHRDVSPQNILVGVDGIARELDFGVAKAVGRIQPERDDGVKGKVQYMPLEQITGSGVTRSADVYAASVVLWEALTGRRLFEGESDAEIMYGVLQGAREPPSALRPDVPRALDEIVMRGLQKDPADRFQTAREMAHAIESAVPPVKTSAVAAWVAENARDDLERRARRIAIVEGHLAHVPGLDRAAPSTSTPSARTALVLGVAAALASAIAIASALPSPSRDAAPRDVSARGLGTHRTADTP